MNYQWNDQRGDTFSSRLPPVCYMALQDKNSIYFLMEAVTGSEMWSIVYEGASGYAEGELPIEHGRYFLSQKPTPRK